MSKGGRTLLSGLVLTALLIGLIFLLRLKRPKLPSEEADSPRAQGPVDAPIQVIEYSDFQCPACKVAQATLSQFLEREKDKMRLSYQHYPLENHRWSALAHRAAECAARQNQFWPYHDRLYAGQSLWADALQAPIEIFMSYAQKEGLGLELFASCLADPDVDEKIREERLAGFGLGVRSTPSFFVNGNLVVGKEALREKLEKLLREGVGSK